jgi:predicted phage terminase large subunit-like protein
MKSLLVNVMFPAWLWAKNPGLRFLSASYGASLATRDNVRVRNIVTSPKFQRYFPIDLLPDQNTKTRYNTSSGGWRIATSVGGVATGEHPDYIFIDDPLSAQQAESEIERAVANDWLDGTISTRGVSRGVRVIVIMQRLHQEDPTGHLLAKGGWTHICWPMEYELSRRNDPNYKPDPRDPRTKAGELLWPSLFSGEKVAKLRIDLGAYGASGQLQQNPAPEGGGLFQREWFPIVEAIPAIVVRRVRGWDTAATQDGGDYTVGTRMCEDEKGIIYVEHIIRGQWSPAGVDMVMKTTAQSDGKLVSIREEKDPAAAGKVVVDARSKLLKGWDYTFVQVSGDKATRAKPFRAQAEAGNVRLVKGAWNEAYIDELTNFPTAKYDDQVDSSSTAFNALVLEPVIGGCLAGKATW